MDRKYLVPAATMAEGVAVWIAFVVVDAVGGWMSASTLWLDVGLSLAASALLVYSGIRCRQVGGPRAGNIVRTTLLVLMASYTYWKIGVVPALILLAAAIAAGVLAILGPVRDS